MALAYTATYNTTTSVAGVVTFAGIDIGTAAGDRDVFISVGNDSAITLNSATIGGVSATIAYQNIQSGVSGAAIITANVPTGITATAVLTFASDPAGIAIGVWVDNNVNLTPTDTDNSQATSGSPSLTITTAATGFVIAQVNHNNDGPTSYIWTNATERFDAAYRGDSRSSGADAAATGGNITITATKSANNGHHLIAAAFTYASASGPANLKTYNTNVKANIKTMDTNVIANVKTFDTNA